MHEFYSLPKELSYLTSFIMFVVRKLVTLNYTFKVTKNEFL